MPKLSSTAPVVFDHSRLASLRDGGGAGPSQSSSDVELVPTRCLVTWGDNSTCQCLVDLSENSVLYTPTQVHCKRQMRSLAVGWDNTLLLDAAGCLWAGGANRCGTLSEDDDKPVRLTKVDLSELDGVPFEAVSAGRDHAVALLEGGRAVVAWGSSNEFGQIGHGPALAEQARPSMVPLSGVIVKQVACGEFHSLMLTVQGEVFACGSNVHGQLGNGKTKPSEQAEKVTGNHLRSMPIRSIAAGAQSSMALSIGGEVFSWGSNRSGRLGLGPGHDHEEMVLTPQRVPNLPGGARAIAAGGRHAAALLRKGRLFLTGDNSCGQLGQSRSETTEVSTFQELPMNDYSLRVRAVALGSSHTLMLSYDGQLYACGSNASGQLGLGGPPEERLVATDTPLPVALNLPGATEDYVVIGLATCNDHNVALALSIPATSSSRLLHLGQMMSNKSSLFARIDDGRPQTSLGQQRQPNEMGGLHRASHRGGTLPSGAEADRLLKLGGSLPPGGGRFSPIQEPGRPSTGYTEGRHQMASSLQSGCTSRIGDDGSNGVVLAVSPKHQHGTRSRGRSNFSVSEDGAYPEEVVLLQPVVQPGVAGSVGFAGLPVSKLEQLMASAEVPEATEAMEELKSALLAAFATPSLLNASFCFPGLYQPRLDAGGLLSAFRALSNLPKVHKLELHLVNAAFEGLTSWATGHDEAASLVHRDQLRGLPALMLSPVLANPQDPQHYELMSRVMRLIAWMPPDGRRELLELIVEDCSEEDVLKTLVRRVREHCDETVNRAHQMQRLSPEIWEGLMLLQLLWGANAAIAERLERSVSTQPELASVGLGLSLSQTLTKIMPLNKSGQDALVLDRFAMAAPRVRPPVPATEFHLRSLAEELVPPELEFRLFVENACAGPITPDEVLELPLYAARTDYGFEYVLPSKIRSFMANRNLVPVSYTRKVLQVESHHAQLNLQHQVARRVAADLEVLPGHEIHIDPALLFFILKVRRDHILEDTAAALQRATPEDLRRQLKVIFDGEQGVDEGGLAREFFRLLSARVFTTDCGLFDTTVAQSARVLWFDKASACESTDFWLAGVILGLVVYNNMPGLDVRFPSVVFRKIKGESLGLEDLRQVYPETFLSLRSLLKWKPEDESLSEEEANSLFENTFCLDFVVSYEANGKTLSKELCPDGKDKAVNMHNRAEFAKLYCEWLLTTSVERQFEPFRKGVRRVCDSSLFNALDGAELEMIVCGEQELDFSQMKSHTVYDGYNEEMPYIEGFWKLLLSFDTEQKKRFLSFVTGSDLAPVGGLQELQLVIQKNGAEPTERLPTAHTCFNLLLLPEYGSQEKLQNLLVTAMHNAEGFGLE